jgi:CarD family transcriptional regulator
MSDGTGHRTHAVKIVLAPKPPVRKPVMEVEMVAVTPTVDDVAETEAEAEATAADTPEVEAAEAPAQPERATGPAAAPHTMRHGGSHGMMNGRPPQISRASNKDETFAEGDHVVYPTHGVGRVEKIAVEEIAGHKLELIHITFEENRMTLRVPVAKARSAGLRKLATRKLFDEALAVLKGKARIKRTMWSRRAQEYEAKINSGDPLAIAEVVRDLHRNAGQPDQSFSERQIYEAAMDRLAAELGALDETDKMTAIVKLTNYIKTLT